MSGIMIVLLGNMLSPYTEDIEECRVIIFAEDEALSNKYHQVKLTFEQYIQVLNLLESFAPHDSDGGFTIADFPKEHKLSPEIRSWK